MRTCFNIWLSHSQTNKCHNAFNRRSINIKIIAKQFQISQQYLIKYAHVQQRKHAFMAISTSIIDGYRFYSFSFSISITVSVSLSLVDFCVRMPKISIKCQRQCLSNGRNEWTKVRKRQRSGERTRERKYSVYRHDTKWDALKWANRLNVMLW